MTVLAGGIPCEVPAHMNDSAHSEAEAKPALIFSCSGGSDAGEIADRTARRLTKEGVGKMFCLAGIGGRVDAILIPARKSPQILVIDGCPLQCARKTMEQAGFSGFQHLELSSLDIKKGKTSPSEENIALAAGKAKEILLKSVD